MPNHVTNKIVIHSPNAEQVLAFVKSEKSDFDFNNLIPMPESLGIEESSTKDAAFVYVLTDGYKNEEHFSAPFRHRKYFGSVFNDFSSWGSELKSSKVDFERIKDNKDSLNQFIELGKTVLENYNKYGCSSWYQWCVKNWNTKWNAYQVVVNGNAIEFDTAWSAPLPVTDILIKKFNLTCTYKAYDEGGNFWFIKEYKDGELVNDRYSVEEDMKPLALELKAWDLDSEEWNEE
ncbi:DUF1281 family ferredoxin-like fold protein [Acinetobacter bereziniae]|uniref:DUF1281 family ferredoxin-like fold protein n=1 Tax=Acinetobacter bereziniae TaxID=106648 RepID=UPI0018FFE26F|nr:hypothetical protein [Acinetobacter bereziniae]MBJ9903176.1 hypothetical protein [Acinetobacter bereziniae]